MKKTFACMIVGVIVSGSSIAQEKIPPPPPPAPPVVNAVPAEPAKVPVSVHKTAPTVPVDVDQKSRVSISDKRKLPPPPPPPIVPPVSDQPATPPSPPVAPRPVDEAMGSTPPAPPLVPSAPPKKVKAMNVVD
jgi:hypothetical protein